MVEGYIGRSVPRVEDDRLLRGAGCYVDDIPADGAYHAAFLRSTHAHARIISLNLEPARRMPGVVAVHDGAAVAGRISPMVFEVAKLVPDSIRDSAEVALREHPMPALPVDRVSYVGQPYVMVVAQTRYQAEDALELIYADLEPLPAIVDAAQALAETDVLVEPSWPDNVALHCRVTKGDAATAFGAAEIIIDEVFRSHRYIASPIETRGVLASVQAADGMMTVWSSTQVAHQLKDFLAETLGRPASTIRVIAPDVGGGFGVKGSMYPEEVLVAFAAMQLGGTVKWIEDRSEHFAATTHGRDQIHRISLAADRTGRVLAVRDDIVHNCGAFLTLGLVVPYNSITHLLGPYDIASVEISLDAVLTNTGIIAPYRGAGRPEAVFAMERAMDQLARELGLHPADVRARNLIPPEAMPYSTGLVYRDGFDQVYDSGDYPELLRCARALADEDEARAAHADRHRVGIGYAAYIEGTGVGPFESADVRLGSDGRIVLVTGASSQGQSHRTTLAQITADALGVRLEDIDVIGGDTAAIATGFGTIASRSLVVAGNAAARAAGELRTRILDLAGDMLEANPADLELVASRIAVRGTPGTGMTLGELAAAMSPYNPHRPQWAPAELRADSVNVPGPVAYAAGVHAAVVAVDPVTGVVDLRRYVIAHDCGRMVNPTVVEGQILGGVMQGIGGALYEEVVYDASGQLTTGSFLDYLLPTAGETPEFRIAHVDRASPLNPLGVKGLGEGGAIGPPAAIANAVEDALAEFGVVVRACPLSPDRVRALIRSSPAATEHSSPEERP